MDANTRAEIAEDMQDILKARATDGIEPSLNTMSILVVARILLAIEADLDSIADSLRTMRAMREGY
jgi:hypothetical protein